MCPDEAPNGMRSLAEWLKTRPPRFYYPENPPTPLKRAPNNPKILWYPFTEGWWAWEYDMESFMSTLKRKQFGKG